MGLFAQRDSERGAILIHVAVGLIALIAFSALVVDYGVLWVSRHQAQNAADAAAHAAADTTRRSAIRPIRRAARNVAPCRCRAEQDLGSGSRRHRGGHHVSGLPAGSARCAGHVRAGGRVSQPASRRQSHSRCSLVRSSALTQQGVRATATAQMFVGDEADCVKPFVDPGQVAGDQHDREPCPWSPRRHVRDGRQQGKPACKP